MQEIIWYILIYGTHLSEEWYNSKLQELINMAHIYTTKKTAYYSLIVN